MKKRCFVRGYSLIEMLVVLGLVGLLLTFAIPAWDAWLARGKIATAVAQLQLAIETASVIAQQQNQTVILCGRSSQNQCASSWEQGQIIMLADKKASLKIINQFPAMSSVLRIVKQQMRAEGDMLFEPNVWNNALTGRITISHIYYPRLSKVLWISRFGSTRVTALIN